MADKPTVSIVIPAYNEAPCLEKLHQELMIACDMLPFHFEFLFVNDGSTDKTEEVLAGLRHRDFRVRYLTLSRNFGHQGALSAGLAFATGDAVIMMDADLQHPPEMIPRLLECWEDGYEIVNTARLDTEDSSLHKRLLSRSFYWVFKILTGVPIKPGTADFRLMSRQSVDALNRLPERHRFIRGLIPWLGFRQTSVPFHAPARWAGHSKYTFLCSLRLALEGLTGFSLFPLRLFAAFGLVVMAASFACGVVTSCATLRGTYGHSLDFVNDLRPFLRRMPARVDRNLERVSGSNAGTVEGETPIHRAFHLRFGLIEPPRKWSGLPSSLREFDRPRTENTIALPSLRIRRGGVFR